MRSLPAALFALFLAACPKEEPTPEPSPEPVPNPRSGSTQLIPAFEVHMVRASPDGRWITFFHHGDANHGELYLTPSDSKSLAMLAQNAALAWAQFSPDGRALAFLVPDGGTEGTVNLMGGPVGSAPSILESRVPMGGWRWLPGGARGLSFSSYSRESRLGTLALHDVAARKRILFGANAPFQASESSDGRVVAARHSMDPGTGLATLTVVDGDAATVVADATWWAFALSPDGKKLAWADSARTLHLTDRDGATSSSADNVWTARFSPSGSRLAWIDTLGIKSETVATGARFSLHDPAFRIGLDFTADSNWVLFHELWSDSDNSGDLFLAGAEGQGEVEVGQKTYFGSWQTAPGSSLVAASVGLQLVSGYYRGGLAIAEGVSLSSTIIADSVFELAYLWSPDGQALAFVDKFDLGTYQGVLKIWSRSTRAVTQVHAQAAEGRYAWTPAGGLVFIAALDADPTHLAYGTGELWHLAPGAAAPTLLDKEAGDFAVVPGSPLRVAYSVFTGDQESGLYVRALP